MERLKKTVQAVRKEKEAMFNTILEDYLNKASAKLKEYLEQSESGKKNLFGCTYFSVEIADIDFDTCTVELGNDVWCEEEFTSFDYPELITPCDYDGTVFKSSYDRELIKRFIEMLEDAGFENIFYYSSSPNYPAVLFPFFCVK